MTTEQEERSRRVWDRLMRVPEIAEMTARVFPAVRSPRYRYWQHGTGRSRHVYGYTTEPAHQGKYWAFEARGSGVLRRVRCVGFSRRHLAKQRAYDWYCKAAGRQRQLFRQP